MRFILSLIVCLTAFTTTAMAQIKVGYVDFQRALLETDDGKKAKAELEKMKSQRQQQLDQVAAVATG